jgi:hypothetical protein
MKFDGFVVETLLYNLVKEYDSDETLLLAARDILVFLTSAQIFRHFFCPFSC